jgi:putative hydroxymethylpyrimidine transport system substrate-binding protein
MSPSTVPIQMAMEQGFFADVGLSVTAGAPILPSRPVNYVVSSTDDLGVAQQPQVAIAKENGAPVVAVGSLLPQPTAAMIWLKKSKIRGIGDLEGKTVAVPGIPYQEEMLESLLRRAGLKPGDVEVKHVGYELVPALLRGNVDATFGGSWNIEGIELRSRGANPVVRRVQDLGVPPYDELMVIVRADRASREPQVIREFMSAVTRAAAAVKEDPETAVRLIEASPERDVGLSHKEIEAQVKATLPLLSPTGYIDPERTGELITWMQDQEMIGQISSLSELFTNEYLPDGQ